jgi:hypothetical protein
MRTRTLVTQKRYFGVDAFLLRSAAARVLARVVGLPPERARISGQNLQQDFGLRTTEGQRLVDDLVAEGLLRPRGGADDYFLASRFAEFATARVVEPLSRPRARHLIVKAGALAEQVNRQWTRNPLEVAAIATYGAYMSRDHHLDELALALVVRSRPASRRGRFRVMTKSQGAQALRLAFRELSSFVRVRVVTDTGALPRPFAVAWEAADD